MLLLRPVKRGFGEGNGVSSHAVSIVQSIEALREEGEEGREGGREMNECGMKEEARTESET